MPNAIRIAPIIDFLINTFILCEPDTINPIPTAIKISENIINITIPTTILILLCVADLRYLSPSAGSRRQHQFPFHIETAAPRSDNLRFNSIKLHTLINIFWRLNFSIIICSIKIELIFFSC